MAPRWPLAGSWMLWSPWRCSAPGTLTVGALLEAMSAVLVRGVGLAWVTVPTGIVAATIPPCHELAVKPE